MPTEEQVVAAIRKVFDPEIPVNVYDLGLIYSIDIADDAVKIDMSLTSQGCPSAQAIPDQVRGLVESELGVKDVTVTVVWDPPWGPERITPEGKKILNIDE